MPPKRLAENPPPPSDEEGEEEEEEEGSSSDEENDNVVYEQNDKEEEKDDDDEEEEEKSSLLKKSIVPATPQKSDSATDSDLESTQPSPSPSAFTIKLHKPPPRSFRSLSKRPSEPETPASNKKSRGGGGDDGETKNKGPIQRLWSEDDEIAILHGLSQYKFEKGADPYADMGAFHDFIKKSLHVDVSKNQLIDKIRRLKKKYQNNLDRSENGEVPVFSKLHDSKSFELSKKVWDENVNQSGKANNNSAATVAGTSTGVTLALPSGRGHDLRVRKPFKVLNEEENNGEEKFEEKSEILEENYPFLKDSFELLGLSAGLKIILKEKLGLIEDGKLKELEVKWKRLKEAELELFVQRMELVHEQVKLTLDLIK
ncbi:hypothetical protein JCGZ_22911 [Jatropha curcas]|uniref:Glabrous enhancer-binding protein-like DBD domain-containing protein n=1 Tax=Jatropha curcas TaxID=180498 RepID=A0A067JPI4_JATCU|nr:STOREKEEPER protein [Jatropha curcas]KDP25881.1 hypothetical protein JCGZ_22911 [Jatropha curcas]